MNINIRQYDNNLDYDKILDLFRSEGAEWEDYLTPKYQVVLNQSITYVVYFNNDLCGYLRAIDDSGFFVWIIDLLVDKKYRGHSIGKLLMEQILNEFPDQHVFVLSDVDEYYKKLGYNYEGSIFKVKSI